jgi:hypothetical protein
MKQVVETIVRTISRKHCGFLFDRFEEPTTDLMVLILFLNFIRWFTVVTLRINVGAPLVPPISKNKMLLIELCEVLYEGSFQV